MHRIKIEEGKKKDFFKQQKQKCDLKKGINQGKFYTQISWQIEILSCLTCVNFLENNFFFFHQK